MEIPDILLRKEEIEDIKLLTAFLETLNDKELEYFEKFDPRWNMRNIYVAALRRRKFPYVELPELLESCKKCFVFCDEDFSALVEFHLPYMEQQLFKQKFPNFIYAQDRRLTEEEKNYLVKRLSLEIYEERGFAQYVYDERFLPTEKLTRFRVEQVEQVSSYYEVVAKTEREAVNAVNLLSNKAKKRNRKRMFAVVCSTKAKPIEDEQITFG